GIDVHLHRNTHSGFRGCLKSPDIQEHSLGRLIFIASCKRDEAVFRIPLHLMPICLSDNAATTNLLRDTQANPKRFSKQQATQPLSFESVVHRKTSQKN